MSANQDEIPDIPGAVPGHDHPTADCPPREAGVRADSTGSPTRPDDAGAAEELAALQDAALDGPQETLLRMLGWRPGDPLPDLESLGDMVEMTDEDDSA
ncbi:hypothetical protein ACFT1B_34515, partial [Streptomyces griseoincarnatus]